LDTNLLDFENSPCFEKWEDPKSGIVSYILNRHVAPVQQSFYFTNRSITNNGRYLWFYTAFPPAGSAEIGRTLGVVDLEKETITNFPDTQFRDGSPMVDLENGDIYWCWAYSIFCRSPEPNSPARLVNSLPKEIHKGRYGKRLATHLTTSTNRKELFIDAHLGNEWLIGTLPMDGGEFQTWQTFERCFNHAQINPNDPDLALIAQDWWIDVTTGEHKDLENRIWTIRRGEKAKPIFEKGDSHAHEWWDADGKHIWYIDYNKGTHKVNIETLENTLVWENGNCHSHSSNCSNYLIGDIGTYTWNRTGCRVAFYNSRTQREVNIVTSPPPPHIPRGDYHLDPHPQFCANDKLVVYTTTVKGQIDVALTKTEDLIAATE
jgi:hypothetical protein